MAGGEGSARRQADELAAELVDILREWSSLAERQANPDLARLTPDEEERFWFLTARGTYAVAETLRLSMTTGIPAPVPPRALDLLKHAGWVIEATLKGKGPRALGPKGRTKTRKVRDEGRVSTGCASAYYRLVEEGSVDDPTPTKTVREALGVSEATAKRSKGQPHEPQYAAFAAAFACFAGPEGERLGWQTEEARRLLKRAGAFRQRGHS